MNAVEPIRETKVINEIEAFLLEWDERNYVMFCIGIYAPLRISDILKLRVRDVRNKSNIHLREYKTKKEQLIPINKPLRKVLDHYIEDKEDHEFLIASRQCNKKGFYGPISRQQAHNIMKKIAKQFGLENVACHTTRKTFGYHYYQQTKDISTLQEIFNHRDTGITKRYIGITQDMKNDAISNFRYKK